MPVVIEGGSLATFFACSNTTDANIRVGVEIFPTLGGAGTDPSATSHDLLPGATVIFGTDAAAWITIYSDVGGGFNLGLARILATKPKGVICTAFIADVANVPPTSMADLKVVKKTKQKGD